MPDLPPEALSEATEAYRSAVTSGISAHIHLVRIVLEAAARFEDPLGEPYTVSPASKLPGAAVRAAAEAMQEEEDARTWPSWERLARVALEAAEPLRVQREEEVRADERRKVAAEYEDLLGSIWLYIGWEYVTKQLTTAQKEMFADAVEASDHRRCAEDCDGSITVERWWRDDSPARQIGEDRGDTS